MRGRGVAVSAGAAGVVVAVAAVLVLPAALGGSSARTVPAAAASTSVVAVSTSAVPSLTPTSLAPSSAAPTSLAAPTTAIPSVAPAVTASSTGVPVSKPLTDGVTVGTSGGVVAIPGKPVRWCPGTFPTDEDFVAYAPGKRPPATWCATGVDVTGVDLAALSMRQVSKGIVWGYAYLRGVYRQGSVAVTTQAANRPSFVDDAPHWTDPPCPKPADGWLHVGRESNPDAIETTISNYEHKHPGELVSVVVFRPTPTSAVMVVAAEHPAAVRAALPQDPSAVCVIAARTTTAQVKAVSQPFENDLRAQGVKYGTWLLETDTGLDAQPTVVATVAWLTPRVEALVAAAPKGLLVVRTWLTPIDPDAPLPPAQSFVSSDPTDSGSTASASS